MESVVLVIHLILALAIIGLVLIQKSEGGGLGIGGGSAGGLTTAQGAKNALSKTTSYCAAGFFVTSLLLGILAGTHHQDGSILDQVSDSPVPAIADEAAPSLDESDIDAAAAAAAEVSEEVKKKTTDSEAAGEIPEAPISE